MRVVITGMGTTNPIGGSVPETWEAALAGRSGINAFDNDWMERYEIPVGFAGFAAREPGEVLGVRETKRMDRSTQLLMVAALEAWEDAGAPEVAGERLGVVASSGIGGVTTLLDGWDTVRERGARRVLPLTVPMLMPNAPAANLSVRFGAKAGSHAPVSACASGAEAIGWAVRMIRSGDADVMIAGGTEACIHPSTLAFFAKMQALSTRNDDPQGASRPYDVNRDGFVMGEGAGVLVLESEEHALARGATIYGEVVGVGMSADAYDVAPPDPTGAGQERAMRLGIADAGIEGSQVSHVNAHGTSTPAGDLVEAKAIARVAGESVLVTATKSMTGHLLGGAGALESILTVLALKHRQVPPTINVEDPEPELPVDLVRDTPRDLPGEGEVYGVNNAFGFGGHNVALVFRNEK
ncbi:MAG TPA: beta-ketoacyl-[acyl-carrier-protein] synthase family protein [Actinomycetales bacterium]|nr:beta-ketoacyl-[acyl-carrier-protein] synthase family protein [Actinomycetales bacterium]